MSGHEPSPAADPRFQTEEGRKVLESRMKLRERFFDRMRRTPAVADDQPQGSGPPNRHGMPTVPVGQTPTAPGRWPVLDLGVQPDVPTSKWSLKVDGACRNPFTLDWDQFMELPQVSDESDFHCVTGWSKLDVSWKGVRFATLAELADPHADAEFVMCHGYDGYTTNVPLVEALKQDVLLVHTAEGEPLPREHGGPCRMITPQLYAWKGAKWINRIEFMVEDRLGLWEAGIYSNTANPWRNDRYNARGMRSGF